MSSYAETEQMHAVAASYSSAAAAYAHALANELDGKPMDRRLLEYFATHADPSGIVCDLCCGPGQIAGYLAKFRPHVLGIDISPEMARQASIRNPHIPFCVGNMCTLAAGTNWSGIACFYGIVHLEDHELQQALSAMADALMPGGRLLIAFHCGSESKAVHSLFGVEVQLTFRFFPLRHVLKAVRDAGFKVELALERAPYQGGEFPSRRGYILALLPLAT